MEPSPTYLPGAKRARVRTAIRHDARESVNSPPLPASAQRDWAHRGRALAVGRATASATGSDIRFSAGIERDVDAFEVTNSMSGDIDGDDRARRDNASRLANVQQTARELLATLAPHGALSARLPDRDSRSANGSAKVDHGSGGTVPLRRSKTLPIWEPFPVTGRVKRTLNR